MYYRKIAEEDVSRNVLKYVVPDIPRNTIDYPMLRAETARTCNCFMTHC